MMLLFYLAQTVKAGDQKGLCLTRVMLNLTPSQSSVRISSNTSNKMDGKRFHTTWWRRLELKSYLDAAVPGMTSYI